MLCESSARQTIHMKCHTLFSVNNNNNINKIKMSSATVVFSTSRVNKVMHMSFNHMKIAEVLDDQVKVAVNVGLQNH